MNGSVVVLVLVELGVIDEKVRAAAGAVDDMIEVLLFPKLKLEVVTVATASPVLEDPKGTAEAETVDTVLAVGDPK